MKIVRVPPLYRDFSKTLSFQNYHKDLTYYALVENSMSWSGIQIGMYHSKGYVLGIWCGGLLRYTMTTKELSIVSY